MRPQTKAFFRHAVSGLALLCLFLFFPFPALTETYGADFPYLQKANAEIVAWLFAADGSVSQPVLQHENNTYYQKRAFRKTAFHYGSAFLDAGASPDLSDPVTFLYGQACNEEAPLAFMKNYLDEEYCLAHDELYLIVPGQTYRLLLFASYQFPSREDDELWQFLPDTSDGSSPQEAFARELQEQTERSLFSRPENLPVYGDRIVMLASCQERRRSVLAGKLIPVKTDGEAFIDVVKLEMDRQESFNGSVTIEGIGEFQVYAQNDPLYSDLRYEAAQSPKRRPLGQGGCGPTSVAMILANLVKPGELFRLGNLAETADGFLFCSCSVNELHCHEIHVPYHPETEEEFRRYLPVVVANMTTGNNIWGFQSRSSAQGSGMGYLPELCDAFSLPVTRCGELTEAVEALQKRDKRRMAVVCATDGSPFTNSSHYLVIAGADDEYVYFLDPMRDNYYERYRTGSYVELLAPGVARIALENVFRCNISPMYIVEEP